MEDKIPELREKKNNKQTKLIDLRRSLFPVNNLKGKHKSVSLKKTVDTPNTDGTKDGKRDKGWCG